MPKPPIVIVTDLKTYRTEDVPDEFMDAIEAELVVEYEDMTDEQKRIVDAGDEIAGTFPQGMTREQLSAWMDERFGH